MPQKFAARKRGDYQKSANLVAHGSVTISPFSGEDHCTALILELYVSSA